VANLDEATELKLKIEELGGILIAVSKKFPTEDIEKVYSLGIKDFGENYVAEAIEKIEALKPLNLRWHFIGRVQSGNLNKLVDKFYLIHSLYKIDHIEKINQRTTGKQKILLQIQHKKDERGYGLKEDEIPKFLTEVAKLDKIELSGLMFIPPAEFDQEEIRSAFKWASAVFLKIKNQMPDSKSWDTLSMGMSGDYEQALEAGSTHVRIGTAVFGKRS
jgi:pyridoxal phosphate enzyme (YggS family)